MTRSKSDVPLCELAMSLIRSGLLYRPARKELTALIPMAYPESFVS